MPNMLPGAAPTAAGMQMSQLPLLQAQAQMSPTAAAAAAAQYQSLADYAAYGATAAYPGNLFHYPYQYFSQKWFILQWKDL